MESKYYISKFTKVFCKNDIYAYYHSLRIKPIYVNRMFHELIQKLAQNQSVEVTIQDLDDHNKEQFLTLIRSLIEYKIFSNEPDYDEKILNRFQNNLPKPYVQIVYFVVTENCNLDCSYCFIENKMDHIIVREKVMTNERAKQGLDFFCRLIQQDIAQFDDEKNIIIYGGEPLTNFKVIEYLLGLIKAYKAEGKLPDKTNVSIISNGTLMTHEIANILNENNVSVAVSLDGATGCANSCRKFHDGSDAFDRITQGIQTVTKAGCSCGLSVTLTEETIKSLDQIEEMVDCYHVNSLGFNILMTDETFQVTPDYNEKAADFIIRAFEIFRQKGIYEDRIMRKVKSFTSSKIYLYDCGALGGNQIVIAPDGQVGICHGYLHSREYFPTTIYDDAFNPINDQVFLEWNKRTPINMPRCMSCEALGICGGGCPQNAENNGANHSIWDLDERFCVHAKKTLEWLIWDLYSKTMESA